MTWEFLRLRAFYVLVGLFTAVGVVALVASLRNESFIAAFSQTRAFIEAWSGLVPDNSLKKLVDVLGYPFAVLFLGLLAYFLDVLRDMTVPTLSSLFLHFN